MLPCRVLGCAATVSPARFHGVASEAWKVRSFLSGLATLLYLVIVPGAAVCVPGAAVCVPGAAVCVPGAAVCVPGAAVCVPGAAVCVPGAAVCVPGAAVVCFDCIILS